MHTIKDQSVIALAALPDGLIVGGTSVGGGGGSHATQTEAKIFLYDPVKREVIFETVPVPGAGNIEGLGVGKNGMVYGFAGGNTLFVFDPKERQVVQTVPGSGGVIFNTLIPGPDGQLIGLRSTGLITIDEATHTVKSVAEYPGISAGIGLRGREVFFAAGPQVVSYTLP
jgi:hypothetical protein